MTAWISPCPTVREALSRATTPGKRLLRALSSRAGGPPSSDISLSESRCMSRRGEGPPASHARHPRLFVGVDDLIQRLLEGKLVDLLDLVRGELYRRSDIVRRDEHALNEKVGRLVLLGRNEIGEVRLPE